MGEELAKLIEAGFIREIKHPDWLANLVMVPKKDKSWRLCVDFKDLNKACPKDPFPLPHIDQIIDATAGHDSMCFLYAYSGYHQIKMKESDQAATAFITPYGPFCFNTMPFGLKNADATYQCMIQTSLEKQIDKTVETYIDDVIIKTRHAKTLIDDLRLTFDNLRVLTPDFDTAKNLIKMASNGEVLKVRKFCIIKRRNFHIWAKAIRSHL